MADWELYTWKYHPHWKTYRFEIRLKGFTLDPMQETRGIIQSLHQQFLRTWNAVYSFSIINNNGKSFFLNRGKDNQILWLANIESVEFSKAFDHIVEKVLNSNETFELDVFTTMVVQFHLPPSSRHVPYIHHVHMIPQEEIRRNGKQN